MRSFSAPRRTLKQLAGGIPGGDLKAIPADAGDRGAAGVQSGAKNFALFLIVLNRHIGFVSYADKGATEDEPDNTYRSRESTASVKAVGASCGKLCPAPSVTTRL